MGIDKEVDMPEKINDSDYESALQRYIFGDIRNAPPLNDNYESRALLNGIKAGDELAKTEFHNRIGAFIVSMILKSLPNIKSQGFGDVYNNVWAKIMMVYNGYSPEKGAITTFLAPAITDAISEYKAFDRNIARIDMKRKSTYIVEEKLRSFDIEPDEIAVAIAQNVKASSLLNNILETDPNSEVEYETPESVAFENAKASLLEDALQALAPRSREVLYRKFGLNGYIPQTLKEISAEMGLPESEIEQIESFAIRMLAEDENALNAASQNPKKHNKEKSISIDLGNEDVFVVDDNLADRMMEDILNLPDEED